MPDNVTGAPDGIAAARMASGKPPRAWSRTPATPPPAPRRRSGPPRPMRGDDGVGGADHGIGQRALACPSAGGLRQRTRRHADSAWLPSSPAGADAALQHRIGGAGLRLTPGPPRRPVADSRGPPRRRPVPAARIGAGPAAALDMDQIALLARRHRPRGHPGRKPISTLSVLGADRPGQRGVKGQRRASDSDKFRPTGVYRGGGCCLQEQDQG